MSEKIAVIGLGYVGLPVALAFARRFPGTIGFDVDKKRGESLRRGHDWTGATTASEFAQSPLTYSSDAADLKGITFFVVCVPTPINAEKRPDLAPLMGASETVGRAVSKGSVVVYESTVYPGTTEEICGPILERFSGLRCGSDFTLGYSPERINPGDREHTLERVMKVVSGQDEATLERVAAVYGAIIKAGIHRAPNIRVAEAAKVIENTQRDLNIALMNELSLIFDRLGLRTKDVLEAAGTKWNFLKFAPGLVGGHCIGVDPYYLTWKAESVGYVPEVILAGRRINDDIGTFLAGKLGRMMAERGIEPAKARVGILGLAFKENVRDLRNSRVPDIAAGLEKMGVTVLVCDPLVDADQARHEYGIEIKPQSELRDLDGLVVAVAHDALVSDRSALFAMVRPNGAIVDVKSVLHPNDVPRGMAYWSL